MNNAENPETFTGRIEIIWNIYLLDQTSKV
jgi:hypothetical protein